MRGPSEEGHLAANLEIIWPTASNRRFSGPSPRIVRWARPDRQPRLLPGGQDHKPCRGLNVRRRPDLRSAASHLRNRPVLNLRKPNSILSGYIEQFA